MQHKHFKKIATILLSISFIFCIQTVAFAAPGVQCTTSPVISGTTATLEVKGIRLAPEVVDWSKYDVVLAQKGLRLSSANDLKPVKFIKDTDIGGDATFVFNIVLNTSYTAYLQDKAGQVSELQSCSFFASRTVGPIVGGDLQTAGGGNTNPAIVGGDLQTAGGSDKKPLNDPGASKGLELRIKNPLGVQSIEDVIQKIMGIIVKLAIPVIICFFIYSGFKFITAQGDKKQLEEAKTMFVQVVIGSIIILGAWTIAAAIVSTVNLITG